jgi:hypothetical protein
MLDPVPVGTSHTNSLPLKATVNLAAANLEWMKPTLSNTRSLLVKGDPVPMVAVAMVVMLQYVPESFFVCSYQNSLSGVSPL